MTEPAYGDPRALRQAVTDRLRQLASERSGSQLADLAIFAHTAKVEAAALTAALQSVAYRRIACRVFVDKAARLAEAPA